METVSTLGALAVKSQFLIRSSSGRNASFLLVVFMVTTGLVLEALVVVAIVVRKRGVVVKVVVDMSELKKHQHHQSEICVSDIASSPNALRVSVVQSVGVFLAMALRDTLIDVALQNIGLEKCPTTSPINGVLRHRARRGEQCLQPWRPRRIEPP